MTDSAKQFDDLLCDLADGSLTEAQRGALFDRLRDEPHVRGRYVEFMLLHADLVWDRARVQVENSKLEIRNSNPKTSSPQFAAGESSSFGFRVSSLAFAAAALIALAVTAWFLFFPEPRTLNPEPSNATHSVAMLTDRQAAVLIDTPGGAAPLNLGSALGPGPIRLASGSMQVMFGSGAVVDLSGPCEFEMIDRNRGRLRRGTLAAYVPTQARGFIVELPGGGRLVDLGTSFVASVDAADRASVCVLKGAVRVEDAAGESRTLTAGGQLALDSTGRVIEASLAAADSEASPIGDAYAVAVAAADPLAYWRFDATDRPRLISVAAGAYPLELSPAAAASADTPGVLRFDDPTGESFATADALAGKLTGEAYTIECWVRPDAAQLGSLVSIDTGVYLGLTGDHDPQNWPARSIRFVHRQLGLSWGGANLAAPYVPGRWTHLTAVRDRNRVMLYVNGKLAASGREAARWPHAPASVLIGRLRSPDPTYDNARPFLGRLDELAIYNRPLSAREIESHYNFRQHPQGETP